MDSAAEKLIFLVCLLTNAAGVRRILCNSMDCFQDIVLSVANLIVV